MEHTNGIREGLEAGDVVLGGGCTTFSPEMIEVYGDVGLDFVWLDFEHSGPSPYDANVFENLTRAAEVAGTELLVRLPSGDPPLVRKVLDAGVRTVLIPRIETADEVRTAVEASRFRYDGSTGDRGVGFSRTQTWGASRPGQVEREDKSIAVGAMIETRAAIDNLDSILAVPSLDFVFVGPADLSISLGESWLDDAPRVGEQINDAVERANDAGVPVGGIHTSADGAQAAIERGYQLLYVGDDVGSTRSVLGERLDALR